MFPSFIGKSNATCLFEPATIRVFGFFYIGISGLLVSLGWIFRRLVWGNCVLCTSSRFISVCMLSFLGLRGSIVDPYGVLWSTFVSYDVSIFVVLVHLFSFWNFQVKQLFTCSNHMVFEHLAYFDRFVFCISWHL
ncbi:hypothetical protein Hanom_Chr10g00930321 [Helianthus anomalus]